MGFYAIYEKLCIEKGVTPTQAARENGISQPSVSMWKKRGSTPNAATVAKLAKYFDVPMSHFLGLNDLTESEQALIAITEMQPNAVITRLDDGTSDDDADIHIDLTGGQAFEHAHEEAHALVDKLNELGALRVSGYMDELLQNPKYQKDKNPPQPE